MLITRVLPARSMWPDLKPEDDATDLAFNRSVKTEIPDVNDPERRKLKTIDIGAENGGADVQH